jgi:hypothetical protein
MKHLVIAVSLVALAGCAKPAPEPEPTTAAEASMPAAAETNVAADGKPSAGKYEVTRADGSKMVDEVKADGTFVTTGADGKVIDTGKWEQKSRAQYCATSDKAGSKQVCYDEKVDDKGVYTSKNPETGEVSTVVRVG